MAPAAAGLALLVADPVRPDGGAARPGRRVHAPALFAYGTLDLGFAADVRHVRAATAARDKPILGIKTQDHGVDLVNAEWGFAQVREAVLRFIRRVTHG